MKKDEKYQELVEFYDKHNGTPCEQIRHQEELESLTEKYSKLKEAFETIVRISADRQFHPSHETVRNQDFKDRWYTIAGLIS